MNPNSFIAIDPGFAEANGTGWCMVLAGRISLFGLATADDHRASLAVRCEQVRRGVPTSYRPTGFSEPVSLHRVIEHMRVYPGPQQKGDQTDLLNLAYLEGLLAAGAPSVELITARTWKGNVPKPVMQARIEKRVREDGLGWRLDEQPKAKEKRGSVLEACGLALFKLGRLGR